MKLIDSELSYKLTYKDIVDIIKIIDDASCHELHIELEDLKLKIVKRDQQIPAPAAVPAAVPVPQDAPAPVPQQSAGKTKSAVKSLPSDKKKDKTEGVPVLSPLAGTFYRAPEPGAKPFVEKGARVKKGQQVGIVEVMKLMNSIKAPVSGTVREILVENEETVGMGQVLMTIVPGQK
jgi:acetyl-CoA carboxylase biotin carboxyl carrier protein